MENNDLIRSEFIVMFSSFSILDSAKYATYHICCPHPILEKKLLLATAQNKQFTSIAFTKAT